MSGVAAINGTDAVIDDILDVARRDPAFRGVLRGPPGSGKTRALRSIIKFWESDGHRTFIASGVKTQANRALSPFTEGLMESRSTLAAERRRKSLMARLPSLVPTVGGMLAPGGSLSAITETVLQNSENRQRAAAPNLNSNEQDVVFHLQNIAGEKRLLLIADDLQYWDQDSLRLLRLLTGENLRTAYPFLKNVGFLVCLTTTTAISHPDACTQVVRSMKASDHAWELRYIGEHQVRDALEIFGCQSQISEEQSKLIYRLCQGHLVLIRKIAEYLAVSEDQEQAWDELLTPRLDAEHLLHGLLQTRLKAHGIEGEKALQVLRVASVIGAIFSKEELACLTRWTNQELDENLASANELGLLLKQDRLIEFSHEVVWRAMLVELGKDAPYLHGILAQCLAKLRPSDYFGRAEHLLQAGDREMAAQLYFAGVLQRVRERELVPPDTRANVICLLEEFEYGDVGRSFEDAWRSFYAGAYRQAMSVLQRIPSGMPIVFCAERDYLLALCLMKSFNQDKMVEARAVLEPWQSLIDTEPELWSRIQTTLLVTHANLGDRATAIGVDRALEKYFQRIKRTDPKTDIAIHILNRKSSALYGSDVALERSRKAAEFFGPVATDGPPRVSGQYYMSLCNLSGNLIVMGEFDSSAEAAQKALNLLANQLLGDLHRSEPVLNNLIVARLLGRSSLAEDILDAFRRLHEESAAAADRHLIMNNYCAALAIFGRLDEASSISEALLAELAEIGKDDGYYRYLAQSNRIAVDHLLGDPSAKQRWIALETMIPKLPLGDEYFLPARHRILLRAFDEVAAGDVERWQQYPRVARANPEDQWRFFGNGFLLSDIQFWSES